MSQPTSPIMAEPDRNFIFTFSTGRSGTAYLAKLLAANLPAAEIHHERTGYQSFGVDTPDASHFTLFNSVGNVAKVQEFWAQKLVRIGRTQKRFYGEASHFNAKAGLLENIHRLADQGKTHIVFLDRDPFKILWSYHNRFDFANVGFTWLFSLDPNYPNKIVPSDDHKKYGQAGIAYWYIQEMLARGEYYRHLLANAPSVTLHHWDLADITQQAGADKLIGALTGTAQSATIPAPENTSQRWFFGEKVRSKLQEMTALLERDCAKLGEDFFKSGRRLATPKRTRRAVRAQNITINAGRTARPRVPRATTEKAIKDAVGLVHQNKFAQAQKMLEDALAGAPNDPDVHCQLGLVHARRGDMEKGCAHLEAAYKQKPNDRIVLRSLTAVLMRIEDYGRAAKLLEPVIEKASDDAAILRNYGTALGFLKRYDECFPPLLRSHQLSPDQPVAYNTLSRFYDESGDTANAIKYGGAGLKLKDQLAHKAFAEIIENRPLTLNDQGHAGDKSVIAFSLWGKAATYNVGAIEYAEKAREFFPNWICRYYHDETVPSRTLHKLEELGAELVAVTANQKRVHGAFWRFFVSDDPTVAWFLCRDTDCRPGHREQAAVEAWRESNKDFHIVRDHVWHSDLILAGLWGGRAGVLPNMERLALEQYGEQGDRYDDQLFLAKAIWPLIKDRSLTHDSVFDVLPAEPFPTGNDRDPPDHVGYSHVLAERTSKMSLSFNAKTMKLTAAEKIE